MKSSSISTRTYKKKSLDSVHGSSKLGMITPYTNFIDVPCHSYWLEFESVVTILITQESHFRHQAPLLIAAVSFPLSYESLFFQSLSLFIDAKKHQLCLLCVALYAPKNCGSYNGKLRRRPHNLR